MASKISDREYVLRILNSMEGKLNNLKAQKIAILLGGRIRQRLMNYGKIPEESPSDKSSEKASPLGRLAD